VTERFKAVLPLIAGAIPGCLFIAWINHALYGSPLASGYGSLSALFSVSYIVPNLERYGRWLVVSQTPLAVVGIAALAVPIKAIWRTREQQQAARLLGASVVVVWALYLIYTPFEAGGFSGSCTRMAGDVSGLGRCSRSCGAGEAPLRIVACAILALVGAHKSTTRRLTEHFRPAKETDMSAAGWSSRRPIHPQ
jgi:hypothetical protein